VASASPNCFIWISDKSSSSSSSSSILGSSLSLSLSFSQVIGSYKQLQSNLAYAKILSVDILYKSGGSQPSGQHATQGLTQQTLRRCHFTAIFPMNTLFW